MVCHNCGKEVSSKFCPYCGTKVPVEELKKVEKAQERERPPREKRKGRLSLIRLSIGILSVGIAAYIIITSARVVYYSSLVGMTDLESRVIMGTALLMLAGGLVAIFTRNTKKKIAPFITALVYFCGAANAYMGYGGIFTTLLGLCIVNAIFGLFFVLCACISKQKKTNTNQKNN